MDNQQFDPPGHLSAKSQSLWRECVPARCRSAGRLALLEAALLALERADEAREAIRGSSLVTKTESTGTLHANPLLKIEREARQQFARIWSDLGLGFDSSVDGRPLEVFLKQQAEYNKL